MARFTSGWVKFYRQVTDSDIGRNGYLLAIWVTLLCRATRFETTITWKGEPRKIPPGSVLLGMREVSEHLQFSKPTIFKWLHYLHNRESISLEVHTRGSLVTICNWNEYQVLEEVVQTQDKRGANGALTERERSATLIGEDKKVRKKNKNVGIRLDYPQEFEDLWFQYGQRGEKKESYTEYQSLNLNDSEKQLLTIAIRNYCYENPVKKYRSYFQKFLRSDWREHAPLSNGKTQLTEDLISVSNNPENYINEVKGKLQ